MQRWLVSYWLWWMEWAKSSYNTLHRQTYGTHIAQDTSEFVSSMQQKKKKTYPLTSQLGGLDEDSTLMIALSWCLDRMTVSCSAKLVIIRDESQSFSSLINTSASAPWHSLTHIYSHVSICQNPMGWNRESMHFKQRWPQLLLILFTYLYMLSAGLQRQKWNS